MRFESINGIYFYRDIYLDSEDGFNQRHGITYRVRHRWKTFQAFQRFKSGIRDPEALPIRAEIQSKVNRREMGDGYSMLAAIRNDQATATIPLIFITGMADLQAMRHSMELGADDFIPKPFSQSELLNAVRTRLSKHQKLVQQATKQLDELRAAMSATVPHELRTPLNGILGYSDIMRKQFEDLEPVEVGRMAERIHKNAKRLERLNQLIHIGSEASLKMEEKGVGGLFSLSLDCFLRA